MPGVNRSRPRLRVVEAVVPRCSIVFFLFQFVPYAIMNPDKEVQENPENQESNTKVRIITEQDSIRGYNKPINKILGPNNGRAQNPIQLKSDKKNGNEQLDLDKRSYENLVRFYEEELRLIALGERATKVFTSYERGNLMNNGVLRYGNLHWFVTDKAKKYLEAI